MPIIFSSTRARTYTTSFQHLCSWNAHQERVGRLLASFFRAGQCLDTIRGGPSNGGGVYQPAIDRAVDIVDGGGWVHLFGEGGICQSNTYLVNGEGDEAEASLRRFKWGMQVLRHTLKND